MKKLICVLLLGFSVFGICVAQEQKNTWKGIMRFDTADCFINLHNALPGMGGVNPDDLVMDY